MAIAETLKEIHDNVPEVYKAGRSKGYSEGYSVGEADAIQSEYDRFWDNYQSNGDRVDYRNGFTAMGWTDETFKPKYDMYPTDTMDMFARCGITDLTIALKGKKLDLSNTTRSTQMFSSSAITKIGSIDIRNITTNDYMFGWCYSLREISELIVDENTKYKSILTTIPQLTTLNITGTIGQDGFAVPNSTKLSKESIISIINALARNEDEEGNVTPTGLTVTLSKTAVNNAFETSEWETLIATKPNWKISLVE